jgi:hypothetical protein
MNHSLISFNHVAPDVGPDRTGTGKPRTLIRSPVADIDVIRNPTSSTNICGCQYSLLIASVNENENVDMGLILYGINMPIVIIDLTKPVTLVMNEDSSKF